MIWSCAFLGTCGHQCLALNPSGTNVLGHMVKQLAEDIAKRKDTPSQKSTSSVSAARADVGNSSESFVWSSFSQWSLWPHGPFKKGPHSDLNLKRGVTGFSLLKTNYVVSAGLFLLYAVWTRGSPKFNDFWCFPQDVCPPVTKPTPYVSFFSLIKHDRCNPDICPPRTFLM